VIVAVSSASSLQAGHKRLTGLLDRGVEKERITKTERDEALERVVFTADLHDLRDRQLVIEAVTEHEPLKTALFAKLDGILAEPDTILASNTSSLPIVRLGRAI
jgi:3-hydroxybutyryl-CoA dehydrogenase